MYSFLLLILQSAFFLSKNGSHAFTLTQHQTFRKSTPLNMAPKYNKTTKKWSPSNADESESAGYGPLGTLLRQGPVPFFNRIKDPEQYDQAVLKMMSGDSTMTSRDEAQANMDAFLQNPNDWVLQKLEDKKNGTKYDYNKANMSTGDLILTGAWTLILLSLAARIIYVNLNGCDTFCQTYHW